MHFTVLPLDVIAPPRARSMAFLLTDNWNDWFQFRTQYSLVVFDSEGTQHHIGAVKVGQFGMAAQQQRPDVPETFDTLGDRFFSLGQDDSYYSRLTELGPELRHGVLTALRDVALDLNLFERAVGEAVTGASLLRYVSHATVTGQFHRMAHGGARLSQYDFRFLPRGPSQVDASQIALEFRVEPESQPPTNIHVLIGRNGVGKTTILNNMARAFMGFPADADGSHLLPELEGVSVDQIASVVSVTFSAFDPFDPPGVQRGVTPRRYAYVGLKRSGGGVGTAAHQKSPNELAGDFADSVVICRQGERATRWRRALESLEADPIFRDAAVAALAPSGEDSADESTDVRELFSRLSSGHKIVLLTVTRLVETVEEKTLVLLDEPEAHLHPPLLSAFVRTLSDLLVDRNGIAIVATHSPVVLQEVPRSCVWILRRSGESVLRERPEVETFGENVGVLTREVFGLEVSHSGFYRMLGDAVAREGDFSRVLRSFEEQLGGEARAIVRALLAEAANNPKES